MPYNKLDLDLDELSKKLDAMAARQNQVRISEKKKINPWIAILFVAILAACAFLFTYSAVYIIDYLVDSKKQEELYGGLADIVNQNTIPSVPTSPTTPTEPTADAVPTEPPEPTEPVILPEYQAIYEMNNDLVGWIRIPDTRINYPVMQSPEAPNYYLDHDFEGNRNPGGCIYARKQCDIFAPCDNVVLYGHHMKNGSMFAGLNSYQSKRFWEAHQMFSFDTLYERHTYQVIAVFKTSGSGSYSFDYHSFNNADSPEDFDEFIAQVHKLQLYNTGLTAQYGDKLLTLSTCDYSLYDGRLVVVAKRIS